MVRRDFPGVRALAWLRLPAGLALRETLRILRPSWRDSTCGAALRGALRELPWLVRERRVIAPALVRLYRLLHG